MELDRQRKTKDPCEGCFLHKSLCMCDLIPRLNLKTKVSLVVHAKELKRTSNTGRIAIKALSNSAMYVRGLDHEALDLSPILTDEYEHLLFYPSDGAQELTNELIEKIAKPIHLIVPDGNWRQASKVHYRHQELVHVPRVKISTPNTSKYHLRTETKEAGMATLQAIALAMKIIEGPQVFESLIRVYEAKLERTLIGRGQLDLKPKLSG